MIVNCNRIKRIIINYYLEKSLRPHRQKPEKIFHQMYFNVLLQAQERTLYKHL